MIRLLNSALRWLFSWRSLWLFALSMAGVYAGFLATEYYEMPAFRAFYFGGFVWVLVVSLALPVLTGDSDE